MTANQLMSRLLDLEIKLWVEGERLCYSAPPGALTADLQSELVKHKAEIIAYLKHSNAANTNSLPPIVPLPRPEKIPLSFAQQRLWFIDQMEPGNPAYNVFSAVRLGGRLDAHALEQGLQELTRRHESLRTTFQSVDGIPHQVIAPRLDLNLQLHELPNAGQPEIAHLAREEATRPFDLANGPLLRCSLLRIAPDDHVLFLSMHHIISDGWSIGVLFREIVLLAQAFAAGKPNPLAPLPFQYADFAVWQRHHLQGEGLDEQLGYWKKQLDGAPAALELPTDHPRPVEQTFRGARLYVDLPRSLSDQLQALCRREGVTLFMLLLAAFNLLLARYSGQNDIVIGSPVANRNRAEIESLVGVFVNNLVLRTDLSGNPTFSELLKRVREVTLGAFDHQDLPFEKLVDELQVRRDLSRNPLFQVMFALQNVPMDIPNLAGLRVQQLQSEPDTAQFELNLSLHETTDGMAGYLAYNTDLFEPATITRLFGHFQRLLEAIAAHPAHRLSQLDLLPAPERQQLLVDWNDTTVDYPSASRCIHELFEQQAERTPDAPAITFEGNSLSYQQLNQRANQLAHFLQQQGAGPETLVGICLQRSLEMVVGLLGILKTGAAYVPLDPTYPSERLAYMLSDSRLPLLLSQAHLLENLPEHSAHVICIDSDWDRIAQESTTALDVAGDGDRPAYIIYTSGSTGRPKGVQVLQKAVVNFLASMSHEPGLTSADRLLSVTTLSFDIAGLELYLPLINGAQVEIVSQEVAADGFRLLERLQTGGATVMQATPATWRLLIESGWTEQNSLKILCGGEALTPALANALLERTDSLWNLYGPTETTIWSTLSRIEKGDKNISIGRPIANTQVYILDAQLNPVPTSVPGELYIGGDGLARGYLNRPELTAERFIPNPFSAAPGARLYRTGDLVRWLPDGVIEYLGRIDHQVKLRGFRIELGEIETALAQQPAVLQAVVVAREDQPGDKRLVAYVIPQPGTRPSASELRSALRTSLPEYMLPSAFVFLEHFPLTPNGKIDRKALPAPDDEHRERAREYVAPRTEMEQAVAQIWAEVLGIERVGIHDNFFELGGHSLLATQVISRARSAYQVDLPFQTLFRMQTVAEIAEFLDGVHISQRLQASAADMEGDRDTGEL